MMKKEMRISAKLKLFFLAMLGTLTLASCGDDDINPNNPIDYGSMINKSYDVTYTVKVADGNTIRDIADLEIQYFDSEGTLHIDTINSSIWSERCYIEIDTGSKIGLKARWIFHDKAQLEALVVAENEKPAENRKTYNFGIDISSPYVSIKTDDTRVESVFSSKRTIGISDKSYTANAIVSGLLQTTMSAEFYSEVVERVQGMKILEENSFPYFDKEYTVNYTVKIVDRRVINDLADLEISYFDNKGNLHKQTISDYHVVQDQYTFKVEGDKVGLKASWILKDKTTLEAVVANEQKKNKNDQIAYDFSLDITSLCSITATNGASREESLKETKREGISGRTYNAMEVVDQLIGKPLYTEFTYRLVKEKNNMTLAESNYDFVE